MTDIETEHPTQPPGVAALRQIGVLTESERLMPILRAAAERRRFMSWPCQVKTAAGLVFAKCERIMPSTATSPALAEYVAEFRHPRSGKRYRQCFLFQWSRPEHIAPRLVKAFPAKQEG